MRRAFVLLLALAGCPVGAAAPCPDDSAPPAADASAARDLAIDAAACSPAPTSTACCLVWVEPPH